MTPTFDRALSLQIDAIHDQLHRLSGAAGVWVNIRCAWLRFRLRRLERRIPL